MGNYLLGELAHYEKIGADFIPVNPWFKEWKDKKGIPRKRGKSPVNLNWTQRVYADDHLNWIKDNEYNLGYRIPENELVVDCDPRNYEFEKSEELLATLFGFTSFEDLRFAFPTVATGGGGWHIYTTLPAGTDPKLIAETVKTLPGIEFKTHGRQVLAAGCRHPDGDYYTWDNCGPKTEIPLTALKLIEREPGKPGAHGSSTGSINGTQLMDLLLDRLDPCDFNDSSLWFPIMAGAHDATGGTGLTEFIEWSLRDPDYHDSEHEIALRWESLHVERGHKNTVGTLIDAVGKSGQDTTDIKSVLAFANIDDMETLDDEDTDEAEMLREVGLAADQIDISDITQTPRGKGGKEGAALLECKKLGKTSNSEERMIAIRMIKAANPIERIEAIEYLVDNRIMKKGHINALLKTLEVELHDTICEVLTNTTIDTYFKGGKHITVEPNGHIYIFRKTHWVKISEKFLSKILFKMLANLKAKMKIEEREITLVTAATLAITIKASTVTSRIHNPLDYKPIINCANGELWIKDDGTHVLRRHRYTSFQTSCLNVDYDPMATAPLFMKTVREIFDNEFDRDEMVDHLAEIMGYTIQPYKSMANWFIFRGNGGDGKSTVLDVLGAILGDAQLMTTEDMLTIGTAGKNKHLSYQLVDKLAVVVEELPAGYMLPDSGLKRLSENKIMDGDPKHATDTVRFKYVGTLFMTANGYPKTKDISKGMIRRANVVPFNRMFDAEEGSADIHRRRDIINDKDEMAGVLNWMLDGYQRVAVRGGFSPPLTCIAAKEEWLQHANNVLRFVAENIIKGLATDRICSAARLNEAYVNWCANESVKSKGRSHFYTDLKTQGFNVTKAHAGQLTVYGGALIETLMTDFDGLGDDL